MPLKIRLKIFTNVANFISAEIYLFLPNNIHNNIIKVHRYCDIDDMIYFR